MDKQNSGKRSWKEIPRKVAAKTVKIFGFGKMPLCILSMIVFAGIFSLIFGVWFAAGFVVMLFIHEMGHVWAFRKKGYKASAPVFIPMLGAFVFSDSMFRSQDDEAYIGFAGPFIGGLAGLAAFIVWLVWPQNYVLLAISFMATFLNLFNLLPISPLDGGKVTQIVGDWFKWVGLAMLLVVTLLFRQPVFLLIWIIVLTDMDIKLKPKLVLGLAAYVGMLVWTYAGYFFQIWYWDLSNILAGALILALIFVGEEEYQKLQNWRKAQKQIAVPRRIKLKWFFLYAGLLVGLTALMAVQFLAISSYRH